MSSHSQRFVKFIPGPEASWLREHSPNAFLLLNLIAERARRFSGNPDGMEIGHAHCGDFKACGMSRQQYRTAKKVLLERSHIEICETCNQE